MGKILQGLTVNVNDNIKSTHNERTGLRCHVKITKLNGGQSKNYQSFSVREPKLFNLMSADIGHFSEGSVVKLKQKLDEKLRGIIDEPLIAGYPHRRDNSLLCRQLTLSAAPTIRLPTHASGVNNGEQLYEERRRWEAQR